jgi:hypothetical protein
MADKPTTTLSNIDLASIFNILKGGFTFANLLKIIALIAAAFAAPALTTTVPEAMSSSGVPANEIANVAIPIVIAVLTWFASTFLKIKPEIVQAVAAWVCNKDSEDAGQRVDTACLLVLKTRHADNDVVLSDLARLAKSISTANFPDPNVVKTTKVS